VIRPLFGDTSMAFDSPLSVFRRRQLVVVIAAVVVVVNFATISDASDAASRRLHRWEHDVSPVTTAARRNDCVETAEKVEWRHDKFELLSSGPESNVQLQIRCGNLPVSYERDICKPLQSRSFVLVFNSLISITRQMRLIT